MDDSMNRTLKLPIGIQGFEKMRTDGFAYVDKTRHIAELVASGTYFFLSRPRRFGKSLFIDTIDCAFSGRRELFEGLYLADHWDWTKKRTVLRIDWVITAPKTPEELKKRISELLDTWEEVWEISPPTDSPGARIHALVERIHARTGEKAVILIDEYDKPILDTIETPGIASQMRDILKDFYGSLKPLDPHLEFVFLTGVSKFAKAGIFSGLNNLKDITLDSRYSSICGYTQSDLTTVFSSWFDRFDPDEVKGWYNGYSWKGEPVYNPFDVLLLFDSGEYGSYWFETGTPTFLIRLLSEQPRTIPDLDTLVAGEDILSSFDIERLKLETLLFQTGYLTIKEQFTVGAVARYRLGFPNLEVRSAFSQMCLDMMKPDSSLLESQGGMAAALNTGDTQALRAYLHTLFSSIPYNWYVNNPVARYEGFYASVVYAWFASVGCEVIPEDTTNKGRVDLTVKTRAAIWLFEFKVKGFNTGYGTVPEKKSPLAQLVDRGYAEKYRTDGRPIKLVGIVFDPESRQVTGWEVGG